MSNKENREDDFGKRLMMLLEAADMTRADLARCFGTSQSTVFSWFGKGFKPSLEYAIKISNLFNVNIEWLATGEGNKFKDSAIPISEDKKYTEIKMLWDRLDEAKKKELLNYGDYIVKK